MFDYTVKSLQLYTNEGKFPKNKNNKCVTYKNDNLHKIAIEIIMKLVI